ncbi:MAG: hypothetical protein ABIM62_07145 [candidate division WOR-3 bacterium]
MSKYKILIFLFNLIFLIGIVFAVYYFYPEKKSEPEENVINLYRTNLESLATTLVDFIIDENFEVITNRIKTMEKDEKIAYFVVIDRDGKIIGSLKENEIGRNFSSFYNFSMLKNLNSEIKNVGEITEIIAPVIFKTEEKDVKIGEIHLGLKIQKEKVALPFDFLAKVAGVGIILFIIILILIQTVIFSDIQRQFAVYEKEHRAFLSLEEIKKEKEKVLKDIEKLKEDKKRAEEEIEKAKAELEMRKKEALESEIGKMVRELEDKRIELEKRIEELKSEEEKLKESIELKKVEQEEIKKRLDIIREKMRKIIEG